MATRFYRNRQVVVTGGCGFVGVQLVSLLLEVGARVLVLDDQSRGKNRLDSEAVAYLVSDAGNLFELQHILDDYQPFAIFNLAAKVAGVLYNSTHHHEMYLANAALQTVPLAAAERVGVPHFLQVSSVCVYSPDHNHPCLEGNGRLGEPYQANAGYAWAKRMGERAVDWSSLAHAVIVRPSNVFGPYDYFDQETAHVIPNLIRKCLDPALPDLVMRTAPGVTREFIYSYDVACGMLAALEHGRHKEAYNIGTNGHTAAPLHVLVKEIQDACGTHKPVSWNAQAGVVTGDPARWSLATRLNELGWQYETGLAEGLKETVAWYKKNQNRNTT